MFSLPLQKLIDSSRFPIHLHAISGRRWCIAATECSLSSFHRLQKRLRSHEADELFTILQLLSPRRSFVGLTLLNHYSHGKCSGQIYSLVHLTLTLPAKRRHAAYIDENFCYSFRTSAVKSKFISDSFFPRTVAFWERILERCLPYPYNRNIFKLMVIFHTYSHKLCPLLAQLTSVSNLLP